MPTTVTSKGQVTIPKPVRDLLGIRPEHRVEFRLEPGGQVVLSNADASPSPAAGNRFARWRGRATSGLSTDQIMALTRGEADGE